MLSTYLSSPLIRSSQGCDTEVRVKGRGKCWEDIRTQGPINSALILSGEALQPKLLAITNHENKPADNNIRPGYQISMYINSFNLCNLMRCSTIISTRGTDKKV